MMLLDYRRDEYDWITTDADIQSHILVFGLLVVAVMSSLGACARFSI